MTRSPRTSLRRKCFSASAEVPRHGRNLAFLRGLLEQNGKPLLSYSATIFLQQRG